MSDKIFIEIRKKYFNIRNENPISDYAVNKNNLSRNPRIFLECNYIIRDKKSLGFD